ncbi:MAG: lamin tail domain-containing protein [Candidatus Eiseniibacteriota bacterium]|nr:MAG: lamin tail domain-containing protein [Candidatus Eisenbacteria bacterium]
MKRIAFILPLFVILFPGFSSAQVVVNEVLASPSIDWDGDSAYYYRDDEWVEIYNASGSPVSLDGYWLADADTTWRYAFSGVLVGHGHLVVFGSESYAWERENGYPAYGLSLSNSGDTVRLWKFVGADSFQVDCCTYSGAAAGTDRSVGRKPDGMAEWFIFDALNPYLGTEPPLGTDCPPTPGGPNGCATSVETESWGSIKALFR